MHKVNSVPDVYGHGCKMVTLHALD